MASRLRIIAQVVLIAGCLVGGLAAQTRYVPDKVGKWTLRPPEYSAGKDQYGLSPAEKSRFETKIGALISTIQQCKVFNPPMGIEPRVAARYYARPFPADDPDFCELQPCATHPPGFYFYILVWYYLLTEPKDRFGHVDYQAPLIVGLVKETPQQVWVAVNHLNSTLGGMPWATYRRLPDGRQIRYKPRVTTARDGGVLVYTYPGLAGDLLVFTKRDRDFWVPVTREQFLSVLIREREGEIADRERESARRVEADKKLPPCDQDYKDWMSGAEERRQSNEIAYQKLKKNDPAVAEEFRATMEKIEADTPGQMKQGIANCEEFRKKIAQQAAEPVAPDRIL